MDMTFGMLVLVTGVLAGAGLTLDCLAIIAEVKRIRERKESGEEK